MPAIKRFVVCAGKLDKPVNKLSLIINLDADSGWKQIDGVQLVGRPQP